MQRMIKKGACLILCLCLALTLFTGCEKRRYVLTTAFEKNELMRINTKSCFLPEMIFFRHSAFSISIRTERFFLSRLLCSAGGAVRIRNNNNVSSVPACCKAMLISFRKPLRLYKPVTVS